MMKKLKTFPLFCLLGMLAFSCEKESADPALEITDQEMEYVVPEIPDEIAAFMNEDDIVRFQAGPGEAFLSDAILKSTRRKTGRWHPVLMLLEYHLQFWPVSSCNPLEAVPCMNMDGSPTGACLYGPAGVGGYSLADGYWFYQTVHSEYYPLFCFPDYAGQGQGFHETTKGKLSFAGTNGPFQDDGEGNKTFRVDAQFLGDQSTGVYNGARGWEIMISYTAAENSPSRPDSQGQGLSQTITFGWVYY